MAAINTLKRAFDAEFSKAVNSLSRRDELNRQEQTLARYNQLRKLEETISYYSSRLPFREAAPMLLPMGKTLMKADAWEVAKDACFGRVLSQRLDDSEEGVCMEAQATLGKAACTAKLAVSRDPELVNTHTIRDCVESLGLMEQAIHRVVHHPGLYWLLYNCTIEVWSIARTLVERGFGSEAKEYVVLAAVVLEANLIFSTEDYLPWRVQLYREACYCMEEEGSVEEVIDFVERATSKLQELDELQSLDPIDPPQAVVKAREGAAHQLAVLKLRYVGQGCSAQEIVSVAEKTVESEMGRIQGLLEGLGRTQDDAVKKNVSEALISIADPVIHKFLEAIKEVLELVKEDSDAMDDPSKDEWEKKVAACSEEVLRMHKVLPLSVHMAMLVMLQDAQWGSQDQGKELAALRISQDLERVPKLEKMGVEGRGEMEAAMDILNGWQQFLGNKDPSTLHTLACSLHKHADMAAACFPNFLTDIAATLRPFVHKNLECIQSKEDPFFSSVAKSMTALLKVFESLKYDDHMHLATISLKLGYLLEMSEDLYMARDILSQALCTIERFRTELLLDTSSVDQSVYQWISSSKCQRTRNAQKAAAGMLEQKQAAERRQKKLKDDFTRRANRSDIFGACTMAETRKATQQIEMASSTPGNPVSKERELLAACGKNVYQRAVLLTEIVKFRSSNHEQEAMLKEIYQLLCSAHEMEEELFISASAEQSLSKNGSIQKPSIVSRTSKSVSMKCPPIRSSGQQVPVSFKVFAKPYGAGVGISMKSVDLPGTGSLNEINSIATVSNLQPNESYVFAVAAFDENGGLVGKLGNSSPQIHSLLPLPLYICWSNLVLLSGSLNFKNIQKMAMGVLINQFVHKNEDRFLWQASPLEAVQLKKENITLATTAELRGFVQASYSFLDGQKKKGNAYHKQCGDANLSPSNQPELNQPMIKPQIYMLKGAQNILMAMEVARYCGDDMLLAEGCVRLNNLLAPLLSTKNRSRFVVKALVTCYKILEGLQNRSNGLQQNLGFQRLQASRAISFCTHTAIEESVCDSEKNLATHLSHLKAQLLQDHNSLEDSPQELRHLQSIILLEPTLHGLGDKIKEHYKAVKPLELEILPALKNGDLSKAWGALQTPQAKESQQYVEMGARIVEAAVCNGGIPEPTISQWTEALSQYIQQGLKVEWLSFDKWSLHEAIEAIQNNESQKQNLEEDAGDAAFGRLAAVMLLQSRLRSLFVHRNSIIQKRNLLNIWFPWWARMQNAMAKMMVSSLPVFQDGDTQVSEEKNVEGIIQVFSTLSRAAVFSERSQCWTELLSAAHCAWNYGRKALNLCPEALSPVPKAEWTQQDDSKKWVLEKCPQNLGRAVTVLCLSVLKLVERMKNGLRLNNIRPPTPPTGVMEGKENIHTQSFTMGSDTQQDVWFSGRDIGIDIKWTLEFFVLALNILQRVERWNAVLKVGREFSDLTEGVFDGSILPYLTQAAQFVGADVLPLQRRLRCAAQDKDQGLSRLENVRLQTREILGKIPLLTQGQSKRTEAKGEGDANSNGVLRPAPSNQEGERGIGSDVQSPVCTRTSPTLEPASGEYAEIVQEYKQVILLLGSKCRTSLLAQAMNELGDVHAHIGDWKKAGQLWSDALDTIMGPYKVLNVWHQELEGKPPEILVENYGMHHLLMAGAVLLGKLIRFTYFGNSGLQLEASRMSSFLLSSCFSCSISHPQRAVDHSSYVPSQLWEGEEMFMNQHSVNTADILAGTNSVSHTLLNSEMYLEALPVLSIYEHVAFHIVKDSTSTIKARMLRFRALNAMGNLSGSYDIVWKLMHGIQLPSGTNPNGGRDLVPVTSTLSYDCAKAPCDGPNREALKFIAETGLPNGLAPVYGQPTCDELNVCRAALLLKAGEEREWWSKVNPENGGPQSQDRECTQNYLLEKAQVLLEGTQNSITSGEEGSSLSETTIGLWCEAACLLSEVKGKQRDHVASLKHALHVLERLRNTEYGSSKGTEEELKDNRGKSTIPVPALFLNARLKMAWSMIKAQHVATCWNVIKFVEQDAADSMSPIAKSEIDRIKASICLLQGKFGEALVKLEAALQTFEDVGVEDSRVVSMLLACGDLCMRFRRIENAGQHYSKAVAAMRLCCIRMGLQEMQKNPELINLHCSGVSLLAEAMAKWGMYLNCTGQYSAAAGILDEVYSKILPFTCTDPAIFAHVAAQLGFSFLKIKGKGADDNIDAGKVTFWNQLALDIALNEVGFDWELVRSIFIQQAMVEIEGGGLCRACALLLKAKEVTTKYKSISFSPQELQIPAIGSIPVWKKEQLKSLEEMSVLESGDAMRVPCGDQDIPIMTLKNYAGLLGQDRCFRAAFQSPSDEECILLHRALLDGSKDLMDRCFFDNCPKLSEMEGELKGSDAAACILWHRDKGPAAVSSTRVSMVYAVINKRGEELESKSGCSECDLEEVRSLYTKVREIVSEIRKLEDGEPRIASLSQNLCRTVTEFLGTPCLLGDGEALPLPLLDTVEALFNVDKGVASVSDAQVSSWLMEVFP